MTMKELSILDVYVLDNLGKIPNDLYFRYLEMKNFILNALASKVKCSDQGNFARAVRILKEIQTEIETWVN